MTASLNCAFLSVKDELTQAMAAVLHDLHPGVDAPPLSPPSVKSHGDLATPIALHMAKAKKKHPMVLAQELVAALAQTPAFSKWVASMTIANPGFINLHLNDAAMQQVAHQILSQGPTFGSLPSNGKKVLIEYVSANPTGPLHVGHARQAALGDALCNLLATQGWEVAREYYYNDAGVQIETLTKSVVFRAMGRAPGCPEWPLEESNPLSKTFYNGEYVVDIAQAFLNKQTVHADGKSITASGDIAVWHDVQSFAVAYLRAEQSKDLDAFGVAFDNYFLESSMHASGTVDAVIQMLASQGHTYEKDGALWLKTTHWGDDQDRVMQKSDGGVTYFVPDVAYHLNKWTRGFHEAINIQGSDHHSTVARVRAGLQGLDVGIPKDYPQYLLHTMVRVHQNGHEVKISKRAGSYVTLRDLIDWTSADAVRFFLLSHKPESHFIFDVDLAVAQNNENPVFYVNYAYTRIQAVLAQHGKPIDADVDLSSLTSDAAKDLLATLAKYPTMLAQAAKDHTPHDIAFYLRDLASAYHSYYGAEKILVPEPDVAAARVALVAAVSQVLENGLNVMGVSPTMLANRNVPAVEMQASGQEE